MRCSGVESWRDIKEGHLSERSYLTFQPVSYGLSPSTQILAGRCLFKFQLCILFISIIELWNHQIALKEGRQKHFSEIIEDCLLTGLKK